MFFISFALNLLNNLNKCITVFISELLSKLQQNFNKILPKSKVYYTEVGGKLVPNNKYTSYTTLNTLVSVKNFSISDLTLKSTNLHNELWNYFNHATNALRSLKIKSFSFGFYYLQGFVFLLFIDACLTDDEPLWEPIEWSLVQTWILFIFIFGWIAENLIVSRYGSYTGRDKRVWMAWYKTFWLIEMYYVLNFAAAALFVIVPFYFEINYSVAFIYSWWNWYTRVFFFKFTSLFVIVLLLAYTLQIGLRWLHWKKLLILIILVNFFLSYLLYTHFIMSFFGYFTNPLWYQKTRPIDYVQLSHEPSKWGWGVAKRDHFTYHVTRTTFWFKNDAPFAAAFFLFHMYLFLSLFFVYLYWIALFRRVISMKEVPLTYTTYCVSSLRQLFYCFLLIYSFIFISFITQYWRLPIEFLWGLDNQSWITNFIQIIVEYPNLINLLF